MTAGRLGWALLAVVVVVETALVVGAFNPAPHTGGDNAGYVSLAHTLLTTGHYTEAFDPAGPPHTKYPPVFPLLLAALMALGARSWVALKSTAAVATVVATALTYLWASRRLGHWSGLVVALLFGASSAVIYYSHWILSDPVFVAFTMASLWALDRQGSVEHDARVDGQTAATAPRRAYLWVVLGVVAAGLAYFTRSAGLPLVVAVLASLAWGRRRLAALAAGVGLAVPALLWWLRGRGAPGSYTSELWMVDPYQPALGNIGPLGLVPRALGNLGGYVLDHGPGGIVGATGPWVAALGVVLLLVAAHGWLSTVRKSVGPAELFLPLYTALVLVWPTVWSGDRFALPLYPLLFLYGAVGLLAVRERVPRAVASLGTAALVLAIALPAAGSWLRASEEARACRRIVDEGGDFACWGPRVGAFVAAAEWSGAALPAGAGVLSRKPRVFYALSGVPSRTFPFSADPDSLLSLADELGTRYVLLDEWDGLAGAYVGGAVVRRPGAFCFLRAFGRPGAGGSQLLGIREPGERGDVQAGASDGVRLETCPTRYVAGTEPRAQPSSSSSRIPLLDGLDP